MKKTLLALCVLMSGAVTLSAQTIAIPGNATASFAPGTVVLVNTVDESGNPVQQVVEIPETQEMKTAKANLFKAGESTVKLTVDIEPDENGENDVPFLVSLMKDSQTGWNSFNTKSEFNVPAGQYVLQVAFKNNYQLFYDLDLTEDKTMTVNADMAVNQMMAQPVLPGGDAIVMPTYLDGMLQGNPYNCSYLYVGQYIHFKGLSRAGYSFTAGRGGPEYYRTSLKMATNVTTSDAVFLWNMLGVNAESVVGISIINPANEVPEGGVVQNKDADYVEVSGKFSDTPAWTNAENRVKCRLNCYRPSNVRQDELAYTTDGMAKYYLCGPVFSLGSYNSLMSLEKMQAEGSDAPVGIVTPCMARTAEGLMCIDTQVNNPYSDTEAVTNMLQAAPEFSYLYSEVNPVFGSSAPVCVTGFSSYRDKSWNYHPVFGIAGYYGNFGESFSVDRALSKITAELNGNSYDFSDYDAYYQWYLTNVSNMKGDLSFRFTNENVSVDGLDGSTRCEIAFSGDNLDNLTLPTVQRMVFKNEAGLPTNKFASTEGNTLDIAAGNYQFTIETKQMGAFRPTFAYFTLSDATLSVEVAPYGTDNFVELPMTKSDADPDPSYGYLWSGNLVDVKAKSDNGWYDVRVTVTNADGIAQKQTVSPAFHVEKMPGDTGVEAVGADNAPARYFNLQGIEIEKPAQGICIRHSNGKSMKIVIR